MNRLLLFLLLASAFGFNAFGEEFTFIYNEGTSQEYRLTFKILLDTPNSVELIKSSTSRIIDELEIPETIELYAKEYSVTKVSASFCIFSSPSEPHGPKKIIFPSTICQITTNGSVNRITEEIILNDSPIEEMNGFGGYYNLKSISFGNAFKAKSIGSFDYCESLLEIDVPESVEEIAGYCFHNCHSLKNVTVPSGLTRIEEGTFSDCEALENISCNSNADIQISYIGNGAFRNCESLKSISLPKVTDIENEAFINCSGLTSVILSRDNDIEIKIGSQAFENCTKLNNLQYEASQLKSIGESAFKNCISLGSFTLSSDCSYLGAGAFAGCTGLEAFLVAGDGSLFAKDGVLMEKSVYFDELYLLLYPSGKKDKSYVMPEEVTNIAGSAFEGAVYLEDLTLSDNLSAIYEGTFRNNSGLINIYGGENITDIRNGAFEGATKLQSIFSLKNVTYLGVMAFRDCKALKSVELPEALNHIPTGTFMGCEALEEVKIPDHYIYIR